MRDICNADEAFVRESYHILAARDDVLVDENGSCNLIPHERLVVNGRGVLFHFATNCLQESRGVRVLADQFVVILLQI